MKRLVDFFRRGKAAVARRDTVLGINRRNVELVLRENPARRLKFADDKLAAKELLERHAVPVAQTLAVCDGPYAIASALSKLEQEQNFVIKPACGGMGRGILVVRERLSEGHFRLAGGGEASLDDLGRHMADTVFGTYSDRLEDRAFVERRIEAHPALAAFWSDGLCDFRVLVLRGRALLAMLRVPTSTSGGRANLHCGGVGLAVDLERGVTTRAVINGTPVQNHPDSGAPLVDVVMPHWQELVDVALRAARAVPLGYLGVDVVLDRDKGPLVLEVNARPGLEIQNVHGLGLGQELAHAT